MRVLLIDIEGQFLDFALRCAAAGHDVRLYREPDKGKLPRYGEGFKGITLVDDWRSSMKWAREGLIMPSGNWRYMRELDSWREMGFRIFGPTYESSRLEINRQAGMEAMEAAGIDVPPFTMFDSLEAAQSFARKKDECFVFKTMGDEDDKSLSFVANDPAEMVGWLQTKIDRGMKLKGPCMLQTKIDMLAEVGVSGWFGPDGFLEGKWQSCWEHKKLMDGEKGPNTGEMGTVCQYAEDDKMAREMLLPMIGTIRKTGHTGDFALGAGIDTKGKVWPFEWTARCGWPAFHIQVASHKGDPCQWMRDLLDGKDTLKVSYDVAIGVVVGQPNYPYGKSPPELVEGNPIGGIEDALDDIHFCGVMRGKGPVMDGGKVAEKPTYQTAGEYVLVATGLGKTVEAARRDVYATVKEIKLPNAMYRTDIGKKLEKPLPKLHGFGYVKATEYG